LAKSHEIRDPVHTFVRIDDQDRRVLDTTPVQRLRHIHQLAMSYLVYPGATHRRFEHSLGVMDLAGAVFDVVTVPENLSDATRRIMPSRAEELGYWRRALRMAALCHDVGHLPFSHAQEGLLPNRWNHERLTVALIAGEPLVHIWPEDTPPLRSKDVARLAGGPEAFGEQFPEEPPPNDWQAMLTEVVRGDAFGVDRMDYLLRDSLHAGVVYGRFDHSRLIDTLRILPATQDGSDAGSLEPHLGVTEGGLQSAEALLLARYFMFSQVYLHPIRRIYDYHLGEFLSEWLPDGYFPVDIENHLMITDVEVLAALREAARVAGSPGHEAARRIVDRHHFKVLWQRNPEDVRHNPDAGNVIYEAACKEFGEPNIRHPPSYTSKNATIDFPVQLWDGRVVSAYSMSEVLQRLPTIASDVVYVEPSLRDKARDWLRGSLRDILSQLPMEED
jgi:uncharacterized protein